MFKNPLPGIDLNLKKVGLKVTYRSTFHSHPCTSYLPRWKHYSSFSLTVTPKHAKLGLQEVQHMSCNEPPKFILFKSKNIKTM